MESILSDLEKRILAVLQKGLPLTLTPYRDMAGEIGIEPEQLLEVLRRWDADGRLRRIGAVVSHVKVGLNAGSMVVWEVQPDRVEVVAPTITSGFISSLPRQSRLDHLVGVLRPLFR